MQGSLDRLLLPLVVVVVDVREHGRDVIDDDDDELVVVMLLLMLLL